MNTETQRALVAIPIVVLIGAGLAWAGSQGGAAFLGLPIYALCIGLAFVINWIAFVPAFVFKTETFYDLTGSITYITVVLVAFMTSPSAGPRAILLVSLVVIWAARLGSFLFMRIRRAGADTRFDDLKPSFPRFLLAWTLQGLWVSFSLAAALAAITAQNQLPLDAFAIAGLLVWLFGFGVEVVADWQKSQFRADAANKGKFIRTGLWSWSRHPNYFGEIVLWLGVAIIAFPVLTGWQYLTLISPIFVTVLLTRISGVPLLETRADEKWGGQADYEAYKANTSVLILLPPKRE